MNNAYTEDKESNKGESFVRITGVNAFTPVEIVHETKWCEDEEATKLPVGGNVAFRYWRLKSANGDVCGAGSDINNKFSRLD